MTKQNMIKQELFSFDIVSFIAEQLTLLSPTVIKHLF